MHPSRAAHCFTISCKQRYRHLTRTRMTRARYVAAVAAAAAAAAHCHGNAAPSRTSASSSVCTDARLCTYTFTGCRHRHPPRRATSHYACSLCVCVRSSRAKHKRDGALRRTDKHRHMPHADTHAPLCYVDFCGLSRIWFFSGGGVEGILLS